MRLDILTLFPEMCAAPFKASILKRAQVAGAVQVRIVDLRDFAHDRHRTVDDKPYGGGAGMVLKVEPLFEAVESLAGAETRVVLMSPQGRRFDQATAAELASGTQHMLLICGHYEGVDERVRQSLVDDEVSIGDYVLTSGTLAALVVADAVIRLLPGVLGSQESAEDESFARGDLLEYPHYTRPATFRGMSVPEVLLSGDHGRIARWRQEQRVIRTASRRPELLAPMGGEDR